MGPAKFFQANYNENLDKRKKPKRKAYGAIFESPIDGKIQDEKMKTVRQTEH